MTDTPVQRSKPTHYVVNAYWIAEWPKVPFKSSQSPKNIARADRGGWPIGEPLTVGKDFYIDKDYKGQEIALPLINQTNSK